MIRGFALFGILLVNLTFFSTPFHAILLDTPWWTAGPDRAAEFAIRTLAEGKFYILFSLLFGLGMAIQMQRAAERGRDFAGYYVRRLLVLLAIGAVHALFLWYGDILTAYAIFGFALLFFRRRQEKTIFIWALVIYVLPVLLSGAATGLLEVARLVPEAAANIERSFAAQNESYQALATAALENYAHGTWRAAFQQRLVDNRDILFGYFFLGPTVVAMFLLGLYVGRRRILHDPEQHLPLLRGLARWGLPSGLLLNIGYAVGAEFTNPAVPTWQWWVAYVLLCAGAPLLSFGYAAALVLLLRDGRWRRHLSPLASAGRMALTNYLLQTVICTTIFYGYGLGLFGRVGPRYWPLLAIGVYAVQLVLSTWWLHRFRYGPMEWAWRALSYGRV